MGLKGGTSKEETVRLLCEFPSRCSSPEFVGTICCGCVVETRSFLLPLTFACSPENREESSRKIPPVGICPQPVLDTLNSGLLKWLISVRTGAADGTPLSNSFPCSRKTQQSNSPWRPSQTASGSSSPVGQNDPNAIQNGIGLRILCLNETPKMGKTREPETVGVAAKNLICFCQQ